MHKQTPLEERLNVITHFIGVLFGCIAFFLLIYNQSNNVKWSLFSIFIYSITIIILFTASTLYHWVTKPKLKHQFRVLDHISIYLLIAGTYTPVCIIILQDSLGWYLLGLVWGIAVFGIILKLFFTGKFEVFSTLLYLVMGWLIVFDFNNLSSNMGSGGIQLLVIGGMAYTIGILFYAIEKIPFNHVIWHVFVLMGAYFHFLMMYKYVI